MKNALTILKVTFIPMLLLFSFSSIGQCSIDAINADITACEGDLFDISINFEYENTSDEFTVAGNGNNYGTFLYADLPITLTSLNADCETPYEFVVTDSENNDCSDFIEWGLVCCEGCDLFDLVIETSECDGGVFTVTFDFEYTGTTNAFFDWEIPGVDSGFAEFSDLPLTITIENTEMNGFDLFINENDNPDCAIEGSFENPCYDPGGDCFIGELNVDVSECNGNLFFVVINFEYENTSDEYFVNINGENYGPFEYANLPLTIDGLESNCDVPVEILVYDSEQNDTCESDANIGIVCCEACDLFDLVIETSECDGGVFTVTFDFEYTGTTNAFFDWEIPGVDSGFAEFSDLPLTITIENTEMNGFDLFINENDNPDCAIEGSFENPCYDPGGDCFIGELNVEVSECDGNLFFVVINFEHENTSDEFTVNGNGNSYGTFAYADLPITIDGLEGDCVTNFEFVVQDVENNDCASDVGIGEVCCGSEECSLSELVIETSECDGGVFTVSFDFEYTGTTNAFFDWEIPGVDSGFAEFSDLPLTITIENTEMNGFDLFINENDNPDCAIEGSFENPCYDPGGDCFIGELNVEVSECDGNLFFVVINFEYENTSDEFTVNGNGNSYGTFAYADLPITIDGLEGDCVTNFEFVVQDVENNDCASDVGIGEVCCGSEECSLSELVIETSECDGGVFTVTFDFEYTGTTNAFFDWEIPGVDSGFAEFSDLPLTITIDNTEMNGFDLFINENDNPDCAIEGSFENPCYDPGGDCFIGELNVEVSECDGNLFFVVINFEYENTSDEFTVNGNGNSYGTFAYADLPITIDGLEGDCVTNFEFVVQDVENNDCASDVGIGEVCCGSEECSLSELVIETSECDGGVFTVTFDFEYTGTTNAFFDWEIPGVDSGFAEFSDLPLTITIENTEMNGFDLFINENDNPDCAIEGSFENPCYDPGGDCFIGELNVEVSECDGNLFFVVINFEYENTSDEFTVNGNGNSYGTFAYADLPITIDGLEGDCVTNFEFVVQDVENNDCASDVGIGEVCCGSEECSLSELVIETSECEGGVFTVTFDFEYTGTTNAFFDWEIPGVDSGFAEFSDLPLTITIENTEMNDFNLFINENDNPDCAIEGSFENPCYDPGGDCFIGELNVEVSECDGNLFFVVINFEYENTSDEFTVNGNGNSYGTFAYADLPITIDGLEGDCVTNFEFVVQDVENNDCASDVGIGEVCCGSEECSLSELVIETSECDGGVFTVTFDFEYSGITNDFFDWNIPGIGEGTAAFEDLPLTITVESSNENVYELLINENDNPDCSTAGEFENPCFESDECFIGELNVEVSECDGNLFFVVINFEYENTSDEFTVNGNGNSYGTFAYADLPITIDGLEADCNLNFEFVVHDVENDDCASDAGIGEVCCDDIECDLFDLNFDLSECDGETFNVVVDFQYEGNTSESFVWEIPGIGSGIVAFADLPISIQITNSTESQFTFFANELENPECSIVGTFGNPCYDPEDCVIDDVSAEVIFCDDALFDVEINFEYENVGTTFAIIGNGVEYGTFEYSDLPVVISELDANCSTEYEFVIIDQENEECSDFVELGTICCEDFNQIAGIISETIIDGQSFKVTFNIDNTTLKDCNIEVYVGGELYAVLESNESTFELGPFNCGQDNVLVIELINSCTEEGLTFEFDLSDIECITDVKVTLDTIDLQWNMVQKILSLEGESTVSANIQLLNTQGALIFSENSVKNGWTKNLETLPGGLYFVRVSNNGPNGTSGLIKKILIY